MPAELAREITRALAIPTIGIGAGVGCDGQVLVMHDLLGLSRRATPRFARSTSALGALASQARARASPTTSRSRSSRRREHELP